MCHTLGVFTVRKQKRPLINFLSNNLICLYFCKACLTPLRECLKDKLLLMRNAVLTFLAILFSTVAFATLPPITGTFTVCVGSMGVLSNTTPGGTWSSGNVSAATIHGTTGRVTGIAIGTAEITYTNGTDSVYATVTVIPGISPIVGPSTPLCSGATTTLTNATPGGTWSSSNTYMATIDSLSGFLTGVGHGYVYIDYTVSPGCKKRTIVNIEWPELAPSTDNLCPGQQTYFSAQQGFSSGGDSWISSNPAVAIVTPTSYTSNGAHDGVVTGVSAGTAVITYIGSVCGVLTKSVSVMPPCAGTPVVPFIESSGSTICSGSEFVLSLVSYPLECGQVIQWQYSSDSSAWSDLPFGNALLGYDYPTVPRYYRCKLTCSALGLSSYSEVTHVDVVPNSIGVFSTIPSVDSPCGPATFYVAACGTSSSLTVITTFGDGYTDTAELDSVWYPSEATIVHTYHASGFYTVKHILYNSGVPLDTVEFSHEVVNCSSLPVKFYYDANSNCVFDADELNNMAPVRTVVDSNGIPVDTLMATSGFYYGALGPPGTVYTFHPTLTTADMMISCPTTGVLSDTITVGGAVYEPNFFGVSCGSSTLFNLHVSSSATTNGLQQRFVLRVTNTSCVPVAPVVALSFSPKYEYDTSVVWSPYMTPSTYSVVGNTVTWNLAPIAAGSITTIVALLSRPTSLGSSLLPGDTANAVIKVTPIIGDADTTNNIIVRCDTVRTSYDPNEILVSPTGNILNGSELEYTVHFENMGNDTAHNVHVMDTLSNDVDLSTLRIVMSSAVMNTVYIREGGYNVVKFDFPNIKLLDSSHNAFNDGMVIYTVKTKTGLPHGTPITNRAGIYFDDNEVVMTNTALNHILVPTINITPAASTVCHTDTARFTATSISLKQPYYHWLVNGVHVGSNSPTYEATGLANGSVVKCLLYNPAHDTVISESNAVVMTVETAPVAGSITGANAVCESGSVMLTASVPGGAWSAGAGATVAAGVVTGVAPGVSTISYAVTNSCATAVTTKNITVNPLPAAGVITAASIVCPGATAPLASGVPGGTWYVSGGHATLSGSVLTGTSAGTATITYMVTNGCGTAIATHIMTVNPLPVAGTISGANSVCVGSMVSLTASVPGGAWSAGAGAGVSAGSVLGLTAGATTISYSVTNVCGTAVAVHNMTVNPLPAAGTITGAGAVCESAAATLTASAAGGAWSISSGAASVSSGVVTGLTAGGVTISYTVNNACGTDIATHTMTVNPAPVAGSITGAGAVCESATTTLTAGLPGGVWSAAGGVSVTGGVVTGVSAGLATISYSVANSCGTAVAQHNMTVNPLPVAGSLTGAATVCVGNTEALTASVPGGVWSVSGGAGTVSGGTVTGISAGTATISYAVTNGCGTAFATHPMMVVASPVAGAMTGASTVCENAQETLTASVPGGAWSAANSNVNVSGGVVTGVWAGATTISYTVTNACGVAVATHSMTVNPLPQAGSISGAATLCVGRQATITATVAGGVWSMSSGYASVINGIVTGIAAGVSTISYVVTNTCGTATAIHNLTVETVPVVNTTTGPKAVCVGQSVTLTNTSPGGTWEASDDKMTVTAGTVTGVNAGDAVILYRVANACGIGVAVHTMTVTPKPEAGSITGKEQVYTGETIVLASTNPGGVWSSSNGNATVADGVVSGKATGDVVILYTVTNPCGSDVAQKDVKVLGDAGPTLLPNPTRSMLTIRANGRQYHSLQITDAAGRQVYSAAYAGSEVTVDVRMLPAGNYQVKLVGDKHSAVEQFTKL